MADHGSFNLIIEILIIHSRTCSNGNVKADSSFNLIIEILIIHSIPVGRS